MKKSRKDGSDLTSTLARQWEYMRGEPKPDWEDSAVFDGFYFKTTHLSCGTVVQIQAGHRRICPKCQPEEWAKEYGTK